MKLFAASVLLVAALLAPASAAAQSVEGYLSLLADTFPQLDSGDGDAVDELRGRVFAEYRRDIGRRIHLNASGFVEGLVADRLAGQLTRAAIVRPQELSVEARWSHADLRVGFSRVVWGRLDELMPTDVVNPLDLTRFFFEGRADARMPVAMVRGRWLPSDALVVEGIYVPFFRAGRYDQLDEVSAPFNVGPRAGLRRMEPTHSLGHAQGGVRATATAGRVDWSMSAYRGFEPLPVYAPAITFVSGFPRVIVEERFPRFTMIGGDFETVRGAWSVRGEVAAFVERALQTPDLQMVRGRTVEAGLGLDRKAGVYRVSSTVMVSTRSADSFNTLDRTDVTVVASVDRSFARETRSVRAFGVYNPTEHSAFARAIASLSLRDAVALEASIGWFAGDGADVLSRFADRDFLYVRLKVFY